MFKINITKKTDGITEGGWEWKLIHASRVTKTCNICGESMNPPARNITFTNIIRSGQHKKFNTVHTCMKMTCLLAQGARLGIPLKEFESIRHYLTK